MAELKFGASENVLGIVAYEVIDQPVRVSVVALVCSTPGTGGYAVEFSWYACVGSNWLAVGSWFVSFEHS